MDAYDSMALLYTSTFNGYKSIVSSGNRSEEIIYPAISKATFPKGEAIIGSSLFPVGNL
jgi:hypothetical protein